MRKLLKDEIRGRKIELNYSVYKHTSPSDKVYIGITKNEPKKRWESGYGYRETPAFYFAIQKYGWKQIKSEVLFSGLTKEEAENKEVELIQFYQSTNSKYGYNIMLGGGHNGGHSLETRKKYSEDRRGEKHPMYGTQGTFFGRKHSIETLAKMSENNTGEKHPLYGKNHTEESKMKMRNSHKKISIIQLTLKGEFVKEHDGIREACRNLGIEKDPSGNGIRSVLKGEGEFAYGFKWIYKDPVQAKRISQSKKKKIPVIQYTLDDDFIREYESISEASRSLGKNPSTLINSFKRKSKTCHGFKWAYKDEIGEYQK
jgi:group I intron endonuclease